MFQIKIIPLSLIKSNGLPIPLKSTDWKYTGKSGRGFSM
jgi:hypothetical protein